MLTVKQMFLLSPFYWESISALQPENISLRDAKYFLFLGKNFLNELFLLSVLNTPIILHYVNEVTIKCLTIITLNRGNTVQIDQQVLFVAVAQLKRSLIFPFNT